MDKPMEFRLTPHPPRRDLVWICEVADFIRIGSLGMVSTSWGLRRELDGTYYARFRLSDMPSQKLQEAMREAAKGETKRKTQKFILQSVQFVEDGGPVMVFKIQEPPLRIQGRKR